ncbi:uncharacterized protein LOC108673437 isoform X1 [Hyalella azteca]|uniref:Uncharacterized protein LOC108673437 isoform X1 n=1 Tax=Hyalella azteca TaxID=294128 RepID=A0A8B7NSR9_HYAAZ|nr:uncharacterized protein LOC108673437 isoform X1 [Hyalella azteca]
MATDEESVEPRGDTVWSVFLDILWWMPEMLASSVEHWTWWLRGGGSSDTMDTLNTLLLGWLFSAILILGLLKLLYDKFLRGDEDEVYIDDVTKAAAVSSTDEVRTETSPQQQQQQEERRVPTIVPAVSALPAGSAGAAAGQDADAVRWINTVMAWLYRGPHSAIAGPYLSLLNDMTARTALETGVLIEVVELLPATPSPVLRNIVVDCAADDSMSVTCDCETSLFLRVQTTRTHRDVTTESEYAAAVQPMRGRLNAAILPHACKTVIKFDGWPEVNIELEGIRNNEKGLGEKELQEVIKEVLSSAIRSMDLEVDLSTDASFPRFKRGRELPDTVVPVGYDSMVREHQTHPPVLKPKIAPPVKLRDIPSVSLGESSFLPKDLGYPEVPSLHSLLTQNASPILTHREERLIAKDVTSFEPNFPFSSGTSDPTNCGVSYCEIRKEITMGQNDYIPPNFLERVTAATLAKVEEKTHSDPVGLFPNFSEEPRVDSRRSSFDHIPYDSEYDEDEDFDDYLEGHPVRKPVSKKDHHSAIEVRELVTKISEVSSKPVLDPLPKNVEVVPHSAATPLGAMGLPHHPKSNFVPSFTTAPQPLGLSALNGKRLLVKIVKATGVGCNKSSVNAYVIVEMDEPNQKFTTATIKETDSPFWDEQFLFELSDMTLELLFELYDECDNSFLGLGIVGIEELVATPSQRQIIPLQARPYEDDAVSGTLTVEFLFLDGGDLPDLTVRCSKVQQSISPQGERVKTTTTTYTKLPLATETMVNGHDSVTASALRGLEQTSTAATQPVTANAKSTVIIHASKKEPAKKLIQVSRLPGGEYSEREDSYSQFDEEPMLDEPEEGTDSDDNYVVNTLQYPFPTTGSSSLPPTKASSVVETSSAASTAAAARESPYGHSADTGDENIELEDDGRGRSRNKPKKESFFGTLKKRFSRSKVRSQSMEPSSQRAKRGRSPPNDAPRTATVGRSVSMERSAKLRPTEPKEEKRKSLPTQNSSPQSSSEHHSTSPSHYLYLLHRQGLLSVPKRGSREPAELRSDTGSARSSLSETSGLSSSSTRTYVNEASMLIIEALENGVLRHYLVPVSLQQRNRWRKRGTKLHVFCAHTFVAKHISSSLNCAVCERSFNRRLGKQGYECRDCGLKCHKPCHVRTELQCPASTVNDMDLEYIRDPREERKQKNQKL